MRYKENMQIFEAYQTVVEEAKKKNKMDEKKGKKKLTDLSGDGKITKKDVLIARGVKLKK